MQILEEFQKRIPDQFLVLDQKPNAGKAQAVRAGMLHGLHKFPEIEYFGFWDADLSTPLSELIWFIQFSGGNLSHDIIIGSRVSRLGAAVERKMIRHYLGRVFSTLASSMLKLPVYDTQCGAKLIHVSRVSQLFNDPFRSKWLFDVEIFKRLVLLETAKNVRGMVLEVPLRVWKDIQGSKLNFVDLFKIPIDLLRIKMHYSGKTK